MNFLDWYRGKNVFVTGHTGFKGSWLSLWLRELGADVVGYALPAEPGSMFDELEIGKEMVSISADIRDEEALLSAMSDAKPDVVIHMAAQALVRASYDDPVANFDTNVIGTVKVLNCVRSVDSIRGALSVTSDKCYHNTGDGVAMVETAPMGGRDPYSASKGCAELVTSSMNASFFMNHPCSIASVRAGNVIGGGDWSRDRIVPDLIRGAMSGQATEIRRPNAIRPWQHVLEPLSAYLQIAQALACGDRSAIGSWNVGPAKESQVTVRVIAEEISRRWPDVCYSIHGEGEQGPHEDKVIALDISKIRQQLGWEPALDISGALDLTVDWYREYMERPEAMTEFTVSQIRRYSDLLLTENKGNRP